MCNSYSSHFVCLSPQTLQHTLYIRQKQGSLWRFQDFCHVALAETVADLRGGSMEPPFGLDLILRNTDDRLNGTLLPD